MPWTTQSPRRRISSPECEARSCWTVCQKHWNSLFVLVLFLLRMTHKMSVWPEVLLFPPRGDKQKELTLMDGKGKWCILNKCKLLTQASNYRAGARFRRGKFATKIIMKIVTKIVTRFPILEHGEKLVVCTCPRIKIESHYTFHYNFRFNFSPSESGPWSSLNHHLLYIIQVQIHRMI